MTSGGGVSLSGTSVGLSTATPSEVGNQSMPSRARKPAGWKPPLHSKGRRGSAGPNGVEVIDAIRPSANASSSARLTRKMPRPPPIQKKPRESARIWVTMSSYRPSLRVYARQAAVALGD